MSAPEAILFRILGNDLPPRHSPGQTLANLSYILSQESDFPGLEKRWLLNRIVCPDLESQLRQLIEQAGQRCDQIPFLPQEYRQIWTDLGATPPECHPWSPEFGQLSPLEQVRIREYIGRAKNLYLMNNNGARNRALQLGFAEGAEWVFPWDGGCFLPDWAWAEIHLAIQTSGIHYVCVPMHRLAEHSTPPGESQRELLAVVEPQIGFCRDSQIRFDPTLRYGSGPKWQLLQRIGVPGPWQHKHGWHSWEDVDTSPAPDAGLWLQAGLAVRLSGSSQDQRYVDEASLWRLRFSSILRFTRQVDRQLLAEFLEPPRFRFWTQLNHPAEHPYVKSLAAQMAADLASVDSAQLESVHIQDYALVFDQISILALDGVLNSTPLSLQRALHCVQRFFLDPEAAVFVNDPLLDLLPQLVSLVPLMDAFTLLNAADAFTEPEWRGIQSWCMGVLQRLMEGSQHFLLSHAGSSTLVDYHLVILVLSVFVKLPDPCCQVIDNLPGLLVSEHHFSHSASVSDQPFVPPFRSGFLASEHAVKSALLSMVNELGCSVADLEFLTRSRCYV